MESSWLAAQSSGTEFYSIENKCSVVPNLKACAAEAAEKLHTSYLSLASCVHGFQRKKRGREKGIKIRVVSNFFASSTRKMIDCHRIASVCAFFKTFT